MQQQTRIRSAGSLFLTSSQSTSDGLFYFKNKVQAVAAIIGRAGQFLTSFRTGKN
ncbi:MAG: hypothetical protein ACAH89_13565 [Rariglobus sp.]